MATFYTESEFGLVVIDEKLSADNGETFLNMKAMTDEEISDIKEACMDWATNGEEDADQIERMEAGLDGIIEYHQVNA